MTERLPLIPVRGVVVFPRTMLPLLIGRPTSLAALEEAQREDLPIFAVAQKDAPQEHITPEDLHRVGTICVIQHAGYRPDGNAQALVEGKQRARLLKVIQTEPYWLAEVERLTPELRDSLRAEALLRQVRELFERYLEITRGGREEALFAGVDFENPDHYADVVAATMDIPFELKQEILEILSPEERLEKLLEILSRELEIFRLGRKIRRKVQEQIVEPQRKVYLREQLKAIQQELGELEPAHGEVEELRKRLEEGDYPENVRERVLRELQRLELMHSFSPEATVSRTYVEWLLDLPWKKRVEVRIDLGHVRRILDRDHYGLEEPKERILEYLAVRTLSPPDRKRGMILALIGPPGVGKTSLGASIAEALGVPLVRASLGGIRDEAEIRGHRRTYVGALPGKIIQGMKRAGVKNPVFLLDEIDKLGADWRGDPAAALLEALDPEQNKQFVDHYIEIPFDLSEVLFICTGNSEHGIPPALLDRMEVIRIPGYTEDEKREIARRHLIPRMLSEIGIPRKDLTFTRDAITLLIRGYTREAGVRQLERALRRIVQKVVRKKLENGEVVRRVTARRVEQLLGPPPYEREHLWDRWRVPGVAFGLAWTPYGGRVQPVETSIFPGKGRLRLTGHIGHVMRESAEASLSYLRAHAHLWDLSADLFRKRDFHVHIPEGAIPKDGPSAGLAITASLLSALLQKPVREGIAISGEITLTGLVLPVGGIREKVLAAHAEGFREVILPQDNARDAEKLPESVRRSLRFRFVRRVEDALEHLFPAPALAREVA